MSPFKILFIVVLIIAVALACYDYIMLYFSHDVTFAVEIVDCLFVAVVAYFIITRGDWNDKRPRHP